MSERAEVGRTIIGRLRLRGTDLDPLSARLRLESLLSGAHLSPVGLPPSATVCIRKLADPKPGLLPVRQPSPRPPPSWDEALAVALRDQLARAARPAHGPVSPNAEAVLFLDTAELLACLASDVCGGAATARWWWRSLFPGSDLARLMVAEWLRRPEYVPAALEAVARRGEARPVLSLFTGDEARTLLVRVSAAHGLAVLAAALQAPEAVAPTEVPLPSSARTSAASTAAPTDAPPEAPWEPWVPESRTPGLTREQRALLGVSLMLLRAPMDVRRASFVPAVVAWRRDTTRPDTAPRHAPTPPVKPAPQAEEAPPRVETRLEADRSLAMEPPEVMPSRSQAIPPPSLPSTIAGAAPPLPSPAEGPADTPTTARPGLAAGVSPEPSIAVAPQAPATLGPPASKASPPEMPSPVLVTSPAVPPPLFEAPPPPRTALPEPLPGRAWGLPIATRLGGLFYLVNLGLSLELYGDFSQPAFPNLPLSLWDFVTLVGRRLLVEPLPADPVWKVLALLSGRKAGEAPGHAFEPPDSWRIPESWLRAFRTKQVQAWTWSIEARRLRVRHPAGFLMLDVPCEEGGPGEAEAAEAWLQRETAPYVAGQAFTLSAGDVQAPAASEAPPLERWLGWLIPYVRARLARALGTAPEDTAALERTLLAHEARVHVTTTHVDVVLALAQLPLEVRVAGLDRDIGWLPSAGRHLTFHFE
jgi:hypothetical protein